MNALPKKFRLPDDIPRISGPVFSVRAMTGLLSLAVELLLAICDELGNSKRDIADLRAVCKHLNFALEPKFFSNLILNLHKHRLEEGKAQLEALASGTTRACKLVKNLEIRSLAPCHNHRLGNRRWISGVGWEKEAEDSPEVNLAMEHMGQYLAPALATLTDLQSVSWKIRPKDPSWTGPCVGIFLASLASLECLELHISYSSIYTIPLNQLAGLHRIILTGGYHLFREEIVQKLGQAIAKSPQVSYLDVGCNYYQELRNVPTLHDLVGQVPPSSPLCLSHLGLTTWRLRLDPITLPHLRSLTSLTLNGNISHRSNLFRDSKTSAATSSGQYCSETSEIWGTFLRELIHLTDLSTDSIDDSLLEYLASYSGLKALTFSRATSSSGMKSNSLADTFYATVLPNHANSLEKLSLRAVYEGNWCFGEHNSVALSQCLKLTHLNMGVNSEQSREQSDNSEQGIVPKIENFDSILNSVVHLPRMRCLTLTPADSEHNRGAGCGRPAMHHRTRVMKLLKNSIDSFELVGLYTYLPEVCIVQQVYKAFQGGEAGEVFKYLPTSDTKLST